MRYRFFAFACLYALCAVSFAQKVVTEQRFAASAAFNLQAGVSCRDGNGGVFVTGAAGSQTLTEAFTKAGSVVWRHYYSDPPTATTKPKFIAADTVSGNVYVAGTIDDPFTGKSGIMVYAISSGGTTVWSANDLTHTDVAGLAIDAGGDPIVAEARPIAVGSSQKVFDLVKFGSLSGSPVWKVTESASATNSTLCEHLVSDGKGNTYALLWSQGTSPFAVILLKINEATGGNLWNVTDPPNGTWGRFAPSTLTILPNGNVLATGPATNFGFPTVSSGIADCFKLTDGSFAYRQILSSGVTGSSFFFEQDSTGGPRALNAPVPDASGNVFYAARIGSGPGLPSLIGKLDTTGKVVWQKNFLAGATHTMIAAGPSAGVFAAAATSTAPVNVQLLNKSGTALWTKTTSGASSSMALSSFNGDATLASGNIVSSLNYGLFGFATLAGATGATTVVGSDDPTGNVPSAYGPSCRDSSNNVYVAAREGLYTSVTEFTPAGSQVWHLTVGSTKATWQGTPTAIAWRSGYLLLAINITGGQGVAVFKLSATNGATSWGVQYSGPGTRYTPLAAAWLPNGNVVVAGGEGTGSGNAVFVAGLSGTNGSKLWESSYSTTTSAFGGLAMDSAGNSLIVSDAIVNGVFGYQMAKVSKSGTQVYSQFEKYNLNQAADACVAVDSLGDAFVAFLSAGSMNLDRYDTHGVFVGSTQTTESGYSPKSCSIFFDAHASSVYVVASMTPNGVATSMVSARYLTSGVLVWQDIFSVASHQTTAPVAASADAFDNLIVAGLATRTSGLSAADIFVRKLAAPKGAIRFSYLYAGTLASVAGLPLGLNVGLDDQPFVFGSIPTLQGPAATDGLLFKLLDPNPPTGHVDSYAATSGVQLSVSAPGVLANDEDVQGGTAVIATAPSHAQSFTLNPDGSFMYTSLPGYKGTDTFAYKPKNSHGLGLATGVTVTVN